jgi:hypothetical protein
LEDQRLEDRRQEERERQLAQERAQLQNALMQSMLGSARSSRSTNHAATNSASQNVANEPDKSSVGKTILKAGAGLLLVAAGWWLTSRAETAHTSQTEISIPADNPTKVCSTCGTASLRNGRFCMQCGKAL